MCLPDLVEGSNFERFERSRQIDMGLASPAGHCVRDGKLDCLSVQHSLDAAADPVRQQHIHPEP